MYRELGALFAHRRESRLDSLERMRAEDDAPERGGRLRLATVDNGITHLRTELAWLDTVEAEFT